MIEDIRKMISEQAVIRPEDVEGAINLMIGTLAGGNKILVVGNGGSATQASHFAAELVGRYKKERQAMPAVSLSTDIANLTAIANDYGYDRVFERQLEALGNEGDLLLALSTSGNSENILKAVEQAKKKKMKAVSLLGKDGGKQKGMADIDIIIDNDDTPRIQEAHLKVLHMMCEIIEETLGGRK